MIRPVFPTAVSLPIITSSSGTPSAGVGGGGGCRADPLPEGSRAEEDVKRKRAKCVESAVQCTLPTHARSIIPILQTQTQPCMNYPLPRALPIPPGSSRQTRRQPGGEHRAGDRHLGRHRAGRPGVRLKPLPGHTGSIRRSGISTGVHNSSQTAIEELSLTFSRFSSPAPLWRVF